MIEPSFSEVFASALDGCTHVVVGLGDEPMVLPVDAVDPGRRRRRPRARRPLRRGRPSTSAAAGPADRGARAAGHLVLGIDVVARGGGADPPSAVPPRCAATSSTVPGEGRWHTALLADGNIGIGGDPVALLRRVRAACWRPAAASWSSSAEPGIGRRPRLGRARVARPPQPPLPLGRRRRSTTSRVTAARGRLRRLTAVHRIGDRWAAVLSEVAPMTRRLGPPTPEQLHLPAAQPGRRGAGRGCGSGIVLRALLRHRPGQPLRPACPAHPIPFPTSPSWGYRLTQGLHVTSGIAADPAAAGQAVVGPPAALRGLPLRDAAHGCC